MSMVLLINSCAYAQEQGTNSTNSKEVESYWYKGEAEISSYSLEQARYGEIRKGTSVLVYVTEPFSSNEFVKSDHQSAGDVSVLKLNRTKNFVTGVYPYSMMTSSFMPFDKPIHSLKISSSSQEWCGHTFMEMKNKNGLEFKINSYFQGESTKTNLKKYPLEDDIWSLIRLLPNRLPQGDLLMIPSFFYLRLQHIDTKAYKVSAKLNRYEDKVEYTLIYPALNRSLKIIFESNFPNKILSWEEIYDDGFGPNKKSLITKGTLLETIKSAYWNKHSNADQYLRKDLKLEE